MPVSAARLASEHPLLGVYHRRHAIRAGVTSCPLMMNSLGLDTTQVLLAGRWQAPADGRQLPLHNPSDGTLLAAFFTHPLLTLKVVAAIHWEALRLWTKGVRLQPRPAPPAAPVTLVSRNPAP